jgi:hypothetical protein
MRSTSCRRPRRDWCSGHGCGAGRASRRCLAFIAISAARRRSTRRAVFPGMGVAHLCATTERTLRRRNGAFGVPLWQMAIGAFIGSAPRAFVCTALDARWARPARPSCEQCEHLSPKSGGGVAHPHRPDQVTRLFPWRRYHGLLVCRLPGVRDSRRGMHHSAVHHVSPNRNPNVVPLAQMLPLAQPNPVVVAGCLPRRRRQFGRGRHRDFGQSSLDPTRRLVEDLATRLAAA